MECFSQESDWTFTPPESPNASQVLMAGKPATQKELKLNLFFHCLGQVSTGDHNFHKDGFINNPELFDTSKIVQSSSMNIKLFGQLYPFWTAFATHNEVLFNTCRKKFMCLNNTWKWSESTYRLIQKEVQGMYPCHKLRSEISNFISYLYVSLKLGVINFDILERTVTNILRFRLLLNNLSFARLPDYILTNFFSPQGNSCLNPAYQVVHCHLDVRWLYLNIIKEISNNDTINNSFLTISFGVDQEVLVLLSELTWLSIVKFNKIELTDLPYTSSLTCVCVKELWTLLLHFITREKFWSCYGSVLYLVLQVTDPPKGRTRTAAKVSRAEYFPCKDRALFVLWHLTSISSLFKYDNHGQYIEDMGDASCCDYSLLDDIVKELLTSDPPESTMRVFLSLLQPVLSNWNYMKSEVLVLLWEYFHKKINSAFFILGGKLDGMAVASKSGQGLVEQVKKQMANSCVFEKTENSFNMFLKLLGHHLQLSKQKGQPVTKICSRIFIKFSSIKQEKLEDLSELGLYHVTSIYLTLAISTDLESTVNKLHDLLSKLTFNKLPSSKQALVIKAKIACLLLLVENDCDATQMVQSAVISNNKILLMEAAITIFSNSIWHRSAIGLIGPWIGECLKRSNGSDASKLLFAFHNIINGIRDGFFSYDVCEELKKQLLEHVTPVLIELATTNAAELAGVFTLLLARHSELGNPSSSLTALYDSWITLDDARLTVRFLSVLFQDDADFDLLLACFPHCQTDIIHAWLKRLLLYDVYNEEETMVKVICQLPGMKQLTCFGRGKVTWDGSISSLIDMFRLAYQLTQSLEDKGTLRNIVQQWLEKMEQWLDSWTQKNQDNKELYRVTAELVAKCPHLIYTRSNPKSLLKCIVDYLLLPALIFKPEFVIPAHRVPHIFEYLPLYIKGLVTLGPTQDMYIGRILRDLVIQYLPRLVRYSGANLARHPLTVSLTDPQTCKVLIQILSGQFLVVRGKSAHPHAHNAVRVILLAYEASGEYVKKQLFTSILPAAFDIIMLCEEHHPVCTELLSWIQTVVGRSEEYSQYLLQELQNSCLKHLAFNAASWFRMAFRLAKLCPKDTTVFLAYLETEICRVEKLRGMKADHGLRTCLEKIKTLFASR